MSTPNRQNSTPPAQQAQQNQQNQQRRNGPQFSPADLNRIVLEYLNKKGYHKTEASLRLESSHAPTPLNSQLNNSGASKAAASNNANSVTSVEKFEPEQYSHAYSMLRMWVESSLDIYRPELYRILYPIFVHCFLDLVSKEAIAAAREFFNKFKQDHEILHGTELSKLSGIGNVDHLNENSVAVAFKKNRYSLSISRTSFNLLLYFLHENESIGGSLLMNLINRYIEPKINTGRINNEEEGIEGSLDDGIKELDVNGDDQIETFNNQPVKLGSLPINSEFSKEVEVELSKDEQNKDELVQEFKLLHKESEDSPMRESLPLPNKTIYDLKREILSVKESREKIKLDNLQASSPSVCMYTFHNTNNELNVLEFNEDSTLVAGGFEDSFIKIWSLDGSPLKSIIKEKNQQQGDEIMNNRKLIGHSGSVYGLSFSPDNRYLLSCSEDKTTKLWSMDTFTPLVNYKGHNHPIWDVEFSPMGHYFATASHDQTARLWSCDHIYPLRIFAGHLNDVDVVKFHPNSTYVLTGSSDKTCRMWDISKGNCVRIFNGHTGPINTMAVSPDGRWLASAGEDSVINIWDIGSGRRLKTMKGHGRTSIYSLEFSREGSILISGGADNSVRVWDIKRGTNDAGPLPEKFTGSQEDSSTLLSNGGKAGSKDEELKRRKEIVPSSDHLASFFTKRTSVYKVHFTRGNLVLAGGAFSN